MKSAWPERGQIEMRLALVAAVIANAGGAVEAEFPRRLLGDDVERAAFGVAAEQSALRTFQHLDALHVIQRSAQALRTAQIHAVDINADALVARGLVAVGEYADAADVHDQRRIARIEGCNAQARDRTVLQIDQRLDVTVAQRGGGEHRNRDRRVLQVRLALLRGDDDVGEAAGLVVFCGDRRRNPRCGATGRLPPGRPRPHADQCHRRSRPQQHIRTRYHDVPPCSSGGALDMSEAD